MQSTFGFKLNSEEPLRSSLDLRLSAAQSSSFRFLLTPLESTLTRTPGPGAAPSSSSDIQICRHFEAKLFVCSYLQPLWQLRKSHLPQNQRLAASFAKHPGGGWVTAMGHRRGATRLVARFS